MKRSREPEDEPGVSRTGSESPDSAAVPRPKIIEIDPAGEATSTSPTNMICLLHKDKAVFKSYAEYESHYSKAHVNRCMECWKNFPSPHLLSVHIEDCHDPLVSLKREKGEHTYSCFVEDCERKCRTPEKRRRHLIDKHLYPKNFFFAVTLHGIEGRRSLLEDHYTRRARRASSLTESVTSNDADDGEASQETDTSTRTRKGSVRSEGELPPTDQMDHLTTAMSELNVVPPSIRFGRGGRAGFARR